MCVCIYSYIYVMWVAALCVGVCVSACVCVSRSLEAACCALICALTVCEHSKGSISVAFHTGLISLPSFPTATGSNLQYMVQREREREAMTFLGSSGATNRLRCNQLVQVLLAPQCSL